MSIVDAENVVLVGRNGVGCSVCRVSKCLILTRKIYAEAGGSVADLFEICSELVGLGQGHCGVIVSQRQVE